MLTENMPLPGSRGATKYPTDVVELYPMASMLCLVGLGVGVGLLLGQTARTPLAHLFAHEDTLTEKITGQVREALRRALPEGLVKHFS